MSDREIRALERQVNAGSGAAAIRLDKLLRRSGLARDYYFEKLMHLFRIQNNLEDFFTSNVPEYVYIEVPDCFGASPESFVIIAHTNPSLGIGWPPTVRVSMGFRILDIVNGLFGEDEHRAKHFRHLFGDLVSPKGPSGKEDFPQNLFARSTRVLTELYEVWVQQNHYQTFRPEHYIPVENHLREAFNEAWEETEDSCSELIENMPYL